MPERTADHAGSGPGPDRIEVRGLRVEAVHGVLPQERERPQPFELDLDLEVALERAGRSDRLDDTVDYGAVAEACAAVIQGPPADLLETVAARVADAVLAGAPRVDAVTVALRKLEPPLDLDVGSVGVRIVRRRDGA